jgi:methionine-rich copper-binding protein CopC
MKRPHAAVALAFGVWVALAASAAASAAPEYVDSEPGDGEEVHKAPDQVSITFSEPLDSSSEIAVFDECGRRVDNGNTQIALTQTTMSVGLDAKPSGHYEVDYTATGLAGVTGTTKGSFHFTAHTGPSCDGSGDGHDHDGDDGKHDGHDNKNGQHKHDDGGHEGEAHEHTSDAGDDHAAHTDGTHEDGHDDHAAGAGPNKRDGPGQDVKRNPPPNLARGESPFPRLEPDSWAVFVALGICVVLGAGGGVALRAIGR